MNWIEIIGYLATAGVAISMLMNSITKLRWINSIGSLLFVLYGILIKSYPIAITNFFILSINMYFLYKIYTKKDNFNLLKVNTKDEYLISFIEYFLSDIRKYYNNFTYDPQKIDNSFLILRNMQVVGIILTKKTDEQTINIELDYVIPEYRDYKAGNYLYKDNINLFKKMGILKITSEVTSEKHKKYFLKIGFKLSNNNKKELLILELDK